MKWMMALRLMLAVAFTARAEAPAEELTRLRRENAALKVEVAKLKEELGAAKPPAPKATKYTAASLVKLIPAEQVPPDGKWDGPHISKAKKIIGAVLIGEWIQLDMVVQQSKNGEDGKGNIRSKLMPPVNAMSVYLDARSSGLLTPIPIEGRTVTVIGKVRQVEIQNRVPNAPVLDIVLEESRLSK
jgi:hypothetical protein